MKHYLVTQLEFAREEFQRVMQGVTSREGEKVLSPFNSLGFMVGHMAVHEHTMWLVMAEQRELYSDIGERFGSGVAATVPQWNEVWDVWHRVTQESDSFLASITDHNVDATLNFREEGMDESIGHTLLRVIKHYWFHIGEAHGLRQALGHQDIPDFVGDVKRMRYR